MTEPMRIKAQSGAGDKIAVTWTDTKGESRSDEAVVS